MALIGLVRVGTDKQNTRRQHDALDPICWKVFEEKTSGKLRTDDRPDLLNALSYIRDGDLLTVQECMSSGASTASLCGAATALRRPCPPRQVLRTPGSCV